MAVHLKLPAVALVLSVAWLASPAMAQSYPSKPVRIIVPSPPGGAIDVTTRAVSPRMAEILGQPVIVENHAGADTMIGTEMAARAAPDGYTLLTVFDNFPLTQYLFKKVPYDAIKSFTPVSLIIRGPMIIGAPAQLGAKNLRQFIDMAKASGKFNYGSAGAGTSSHLAVELFKSTSGIDVQAVHYKGAAPAVGDLLGGHIQLMIAGFGTLIQPARSGKVVPLAVTATKRVPVLPDVPTVAETYPGFEAHSWCGMLAPAGVPAEIVNRVNAALAKVLAEPATRTRFENQGWEVVGSSPEEFGKWIVKHSETWGRVIRERNISLDK